MLPLLIALEYYASHSQPIRDNPWFSCDMMAAILLALNEEPRSILVTKPQISCLSWQYCVYILKYLFTVEDE